jgi:hypothetical protein
MVLFISSDRVSVWSKETDESLVVDMVVTESDYRDFASSERAAPLWGA